MNQGREVSIGAGKLLRHESGRFSKRELDEKTKNYVRDKKNWQLLSGPWFWSLIYSPCQRASTWIVSEAEKGSRLDEKIVVASKIIECAMNLVKNFDWLLKKHFITLREVWQRWMQNEASTFSLNCCSLTRFRGASMIYAVHAYLSSPHFNPSRVAHDSRFSRKLSPKKKCRQHPYRPGARRLAPKPSINLPEKEKFENKLFLLLGGLTLYWQRLLYRFK